LFDIVKRGSIRKVAAAKAVGDPHPRRCLTARVLGSISKQAGLSVNADQVSAIRDQESESDFLIPDT